MNSKTIQAVQSIAESVILPPNFSEERFQKLLTPFFDDYKAPETENLETLKVSVGEGNCVLAVTSTKIANIRFRLKDFLLETSKAVVKGKATKDDWLALSIVIVDYLQKVSEMRAYSLSKQEAQVLYEMCRMITDKQKVTIDGLFQSVPDTLSQKDILDSLKVLEYVQCIRYDLDQILLTEDIVFVEQEGAES